MGNSSTQTVAGTHWDAHGKPVMEKVTEKVFVLSS